MQADIRRLVRQEPCGLRTRQRHLLLNNKYLLCLRNQACV
jgi:hypothetical protein